MAALKIEIHQADPTGRASGTLTDCKPCLRTVTTRILDEVSMAEILHADANWSVADHSAAVRR